jgi:hypothetical protein
MRVTAAALLALAMLVAPAGPVLGEPMDQAAFEQELDDAQADADEALEAYRDGDEEAALAAAERVRDRFSFEEGGASPLEEAIKEHSAPSIADAVKAHAAKLVSAIEADEPLEEVEAVHGELAPSLNRLVLVAKGEHAPASQRQLNTEEDIRAGVDEVRELVDEAAGLHEDGDAGEAQAAAEEAFFTFETNGVGPDTAAIDEPLEDDVEQRIQAFQEGRDPGLAGLIAEGAPVDEVRDQAEHVHEGLDQIEELLIATKPPQSLGDANQDGDVTIVDALLTAQASLGVEASKPSMDANQDGDVTIVDALLIAQASLGVRTL